MKNILICGATGFIGQNLVRYYSKNNKVYAVWNKRKPNFNHPNIQWIKADLRNPEDIKDIFKNIDICLQFAATTTGAKDIISKPYIHVTDNVVMHSLL